MKVTAFAPAKVNLYLHLTGRRADGYHLIDGLVGFADIGDRVTVRPAPSLSLKISGPEAGCLTGQDDDNLVLRAARLLAAYAGIEAAGADLELEKNLPVASGIGGGSSDAAATLRTLCSLWGLVLDEAVLASLGARLGADVPVCLYARAAWISGVGELIEPAPALPPAGILLANPRRPLPSGTVFAARNGPFRGGPATRLSAMPRDAVGLAHALACCRNDLTEPAIELVPEIRDVLTALARLPGALIARMSGSGATCFALFPDRAEAEQARAALNAARPQWWCAAGGLVAEAGISR